MCACLSPTLFRQTTVLAPQPKPISSLTYRPIFMSISHPRSFQSRLSYQHPHQMLENTLNSTIFFVSHSLPSTPTPTGFPTIPDHPRPICQNDRISLSMNDRIPPFPHAHTYISLALHYDTASVRVIFISIPVTFLELDTLASTISKHLTIRVYCFFYPYTP